MEIVARWLVPGKSYADEDAERDRLRAVRRRLQSLPEEPDRWEDVPTGITYADEWTDTPTGERGKWLAEKGIKVVLAKDWAQVIGFGFDSGRLPLKPAGRRPGWRQSRPGTRSGARRAARLLIPASWPAP